MSKKCIDYYLNSQKTFFWQILVIYCIIALQGGVVVKFDYQKLPKVELHLHLDGSVKIKTLKELTGLDNKEIENRCVVLNCKNLDEYLTKFDLPISIMQTKKNITRITSDLIEDLKKDNVIYAEIRFAPYLHTKEGLSYYDVIDAVLSGVKDDPDIKVNFILCMLRNLDYTENKKVIDYAKIYLNHGICGVDIAGSETLSTNKFNKLFKYAKKLGVPFTIHAGEVTTKSLKKAIKLKPSRIGHGIKAIEDIKLIDKIKKNNITLEICPTSNLNTKAFRDIKDFPIKTLEDLKVLVTINTDNRTVSNTNLCNEYEILAKNFNYTKDDFIRLNKNAIKAVFLSSEEKILLEEKYNDLLKKNSV